MKHLIMFSFLALTVASSVGATLIHVDRGNAAEAHKVVASELTLTRSQVAMLRATSTTPDYIAPAPPR